MEAAPINGCRKFRKEHKNGGQKRGSEGLLQKRRVDPRDHSGQGQRRDIDARVHELRITEVNPRNRADMVLEPFAKRTVE